MADAQHLYAERGLRSVPRLLSLQNRNPFSPTYGCLHRDYWLYKTSDFPDAVRQFAVHALALAYAGRSLRMIRTIEMHTPREQTPAERTPSNLRVLAEYPDG